MTPLELGRLLSEAGTRRRLAAAALLEAACEYIQAVYDARALPEPNTVIEPAFQRLATAVERYELAEANSRKLAQGKDPVDSPP